MDATSGDRRQSPAHARVNNDNDKNNGDNAANNGGDVEMSRKNGRGVEFGPVTGPSSSSSGATTTNSERKIPASLDVPPSNEAPLGPIESWSGNDDISKEDLGLKKKDFSWATDVRPPFTDRSCNVDNEAKPHRVTPEAPGGAADARDVISHGPAAGNVHASSTVAIDGSNTVNRSTNANQRNATNSNETQNTGTPFLGAVTNNQGLLQEQPPGANPSRDIEWNAQNIHEDSTPIIATATLVPDQSISQIEAQISQDQRPNSGAASTPWWRSKCAITGMLVAGFTIVSLLVVASTLGALLVNSNMNNDSSSANILEDSPTEETVTDSPMDSPTPSPTAIAIIDQNNVGATAAPVTSTVTFSTVIPTLGQSNDSGATASPVTPLSNFPTMNSFPDHNDVDDNDNYDQGNADYISSCISFQKVVPSQDCYHCAKGVAIDNDTSIITFDTYLSFNTLIRHEDKTDNLFEASSRVNATWTETSTHEMETWSYNPVSISKATAVMGFPYEWVQYEPLVGSVYVFENKDETSSTPQQSQPSNLIGNWELATRITQEPGDQEPHGYFGSSVDLNDDVVIVGAPSNGYSGSAYIFRRKSSDENTSNSENEDWHQEAKLELENHFESANFGRKVAIEENIAVVSAPNALISSNNKNDTGDISSASSSPYLMGAVYVFLRDPNTGLWPKSPSQILTANPSYSGEQAKYDEFGGDIDLSGGTLAVGHRMENKFRGSVYLYDFQPSSPEGGKFVFRQRITAAGGGGKFDNFGYQVALHDDILAVSAGHPYFGEGPVYDYDGSLVIYRRMFTQEEAENSGVGKWVQIAQWHPPHSDEHDFGSDIGVSGNNVIVASSHDSYVYDIEGCF